MAWPLKPDGEITWGYNFGWYACIGYARLREETMTDRLDEIERKLQAMPTLTNNLERAVISATWVNAFGSWLLQVARAAQKINDQDPRRWRVRGTTVWINCVYCPARVVDRDTNDLTHEPECPWLLLHEAFSGGGDAAGD